MFGGFLEGGIFGFFFGFMFFLGGYFGSGFLGSVTSKVVLLTGLFRVCGVVRVFLIALKVLYYVFSLMLPWKQPNENKTKIISYLVCAAMEGK